MTVELLETADFLLSYPPFDLLGQEVVAALVLDVQSTYARRGTVILSPGDTCDWLYIIRSGATETRNPDGDLLSRLSAGDAFGIHAMMNEGIARNRVEALEDTLLYLLPRKRFDQLRRDYASFAYFYVPVGAERLRTARDVADGSGQTRTSLSYFTNTLKDMVTRAPVTVTPDMSIQAAAEVMRRNNVSCVLVEEREALVGIVSDKDLRNRVVADAVPVTAAVQTIMTPSPLCLTGTDTAFDALLLMTRKMFRHVPVLEGGRPIGVLSNSNLLEHEAPSVLAIVKGIRKARMISDIAPYVTRRGDVLGAMLDAGAHPEHVGHALSSVTDAVVVQLVELAAHTLGAAPVPYAWLAVGEQARQEQTGHARLESILVLDATYDPTVHGTYFQSLADYVCQAMMDMGFEIASTALSAHHAEARRTVADWRSALDSVCDEARFDQLRTVFDCRLVTGAPELFTAFEVMLTACVRSQPDLVPHMAAAAVTPLPPLGFFGDQVVDGAGTHQAALDLKAAGLKLVSDMVQVMAVSVHCPAQNTYERLRTLSQGQTCWQGQDVRDLLDAYDVLGNTLLRQQADRIRQGAIPDDFLDIKAATRFTRTHLQDAFTVIKSMQGAMADHFASLSGQ